MTAKLVFIALVAIPLSIGMGLVVEALFPSMSAQMQGLIGGAITVPTLLAVASVAMD
jgi:hypothetical protein